MKLTPESLLAMNKEELAVLTPVEIHKPELLPEKNSGCIRCNHCTKCYYCSDCISCNYSHSCANGEFLDQCTRVLDSGHCNKCDDCLHCTYCNSCFRCRDCMYCIGIIHGRNLEYVAFGVQLTREQYLALREKWA